MQDAPVTLSVGTLIRERYEVKSLLGQGNTGAVYVVEDQRVKRARQYVFALKEIILDKQERYQCILNSVQLTQINHHALPHMYHVFNDDSRDRVCLVMDYVEGQDLETMRQHRAEQRFSWPEVARLMASIVDAVSYLHRQEPCIVHGDIKPVNIRTVQGEEGFMLVDMEVVRAHHPSTGVLSALSGYKAPEQEGKAADVRADVYGLGAVCYTLLTGSVPPPALERMAQIERGQADPLQSANSAVPTVPLYVSRSIHRAMSIYAHERFFSVEEFWQALQTPPEEFKPMVDEGVQPPPATVSRPVVPEQIRGLAAMQTSLFSRQHRSYKVPFVFLKRHVAHLLLLIVLLLLGASAGTWTFVQSHQATSTATKRTAKISLALSIPVLRSTITIITPTSSPNNYPGVVGSYAGTLVDISSKVSQNMILQGVHQMGGTINGYFTVGSPLAISGPFSGTIDFSKHFQFTVNDASGHPVLFLEGAIQSATSLSGDFYECASAPTQGEQCSRALDGYGIWNVLLMTSTYP